MALNMDKHIYDHKGIREYEGDETGNIVLGQSGIDVLTNQNDIVTAGEDGTTSKIGGVAFDCTAIKQWTQIMVLGKPASTGCEVTFQVKTGAKTYTDITVFIPVGSSIYGSFFKVKMDQNPATNNEALYLTRG
ncbi:MAG: hypothetical protein Unbinned4409contig1002_37 [Prokaryotic dsDNA virus sp.]|nr:MAG: hypothetical protein Unbinned4409contig1002_37 [Prokaryotic dsDNA virus sp.]|tara:strand:+ start:15145 stop:15543 length:399 start_codon:yes stop_codon:yes gene_type:complete